MPSDSLHDLHDAESTYRKRDEEYFGYVANLADTVEPDQATENAFRLITAVRKYMNYTADGEMFGEHVDGLQTATGLTDLLVDGGYTHQELGARCATHGISQHFTGT